MKLSLEDREAYIEHRIHLVESRRLAYDQFDKSVFFLAGGGLTISLTLIEKIIPFSAANFQFILISSWLLFTFSILVTLGSFLTSQKALDLELDKVNQVLSTENTNILESVNPHSRKTAILNQVSFYSIVGAITALVIFVGINVSGFEHKKQEGKSTLKIEVIKNVKTIK